MFRQYVYSIDGVRLAMKAQGQTLFYHYNPRGDVVAMTDQNGQVVANYEYDTWGNVLKSEATGTAADNPFGYAGYMYDKEIGYNPEHGVFLSVDPDPGDEDPSYEICPCCGFQFRYDDLDQGYTFVEYREKWLDSGANWFSSARKPNKWFLEKQFKNIE